MRLGCHVRFGMMSYSSFTGAAETGAPAHHFHDNGRAARATPVANNLEAAASCDSQPQS
jgi:hypothetical protein